MNALVSLCFLALALVCQATPQGLQQSSLSSEEDLSNRHYQSNLEGLQLSRHQQNNLAALLNKLQKLNSNPLLSSSELNSQDQQQLRRHLNPVEENSQENPTIQVRGPAYDFGLGFPYVQ